MLWVMRLLSLGFGDLKMAVETLKMNNDKVIQKNVLKKKLNKTLCKTSEIDQVLTCDEPAAYTDFTKLIT